MRMFLRRMLLALTAIVLAGCASQREMVGQIEKGSLATEEATNRLLLLNVVRAYHRRPMHFVRINEMRGPMGVGAPTFTIPTPFGPDFTSQIYNLSTSIKLDQPSIALQLLDNQDFYRGVTTPLKPETMQYLLEQGWPQQMILHLLVREIELVRDSNTVQRWVNYPENEEVFAQFQKKLLTFKGCDWVMDQQKKEVNYGPPLALDRSTPAAQISALRAAALELKPLDPAAGAASLYQPFVTRQTGTLKAVPFDPDKPCAHLAALKGSNKPALAQIKGDYAAATTAPEYLVFTLRSTEAIIYYLGELSRLHLDGPIDGGATRRKTVSFAYQGYRATGSQVTAPLFYMDRNGPGDAAVEVTYEGQRYSIPRNAGRSMHVLSLVTQLMALHNKAAEAPTTQSVRIVNP